MIFILLSERMRTLYSNIPSSNSNEDIDEIVYTVFRENYFEGKWSTDYIWSNARQGYRDVHR